MQNYRKVIDISFVIDTVGLLLYIFSGVCFIVLLLILFAFIFCLFS